LHIGQANITGIFGWKNPSRKLANFVIIKYSFIFWAGSATLEVYMSKYIVGIMTLVSFKRINTTSKLVIHLNFTLRSKYD
jgi:hypothetical protein